MNAEKENELLSGKIHPVEGRYSGEDIYGETASIEEEVQIITNFFDRWIQKRLQEILTLD